MKRHTLMAGSPACCGSLGRGTVASGQKGDPLLGEKSAAKRKRSRMCYFLWDVSVPKASTKLKLSLPTPTNGAGVSRSLQSHSMESSEKDPRKVCPSST